MGTRSNRLRVNVGADKVNVQTRVDRSKAVGMTAPQSPSYQNQSGVKEACDACVERGAQLAAADTAVQIAELGATKARSARDAAQADYDSAYDVYVALVEHHAATPQEVQGLGLTVLKRTSHALIPPTEVRARLVAEENAVRIAVTPAPGLRNCVMEISNGAAEPRIWRRLPGVGTRQDVSGLEPGTYLVRAASVRATEQSAFTEPVAVTVR